MKKVILFVACFIFYAHSAYAMRPCETSKLTKSEAMERYDDIVVVKINSSKDKTEWFLEQQKEQHKNEPEELKKLEEYLVAYVTYDATVLENFKGSLKGEIKLAEIRAAFRFESTLVTGFYYILGLDNESLDGGIIMPGCTIISIGTSNREGDFLDKVEEFRK